MTTCHWHACYKPPLPGTHYCADHPVKAIKRAPAAELHTSELPVAERAPERPSAPVVLEQEHRPCVACGQRHGSIGVWRRCLEAKIVELRAANASLVAAAVQAGCGER